MLQRPVLQHVVDINVITQLLQNPNFSPHMLLTQNLNIKNNNNNTNITNSNVNTNTNNNTYYNNNNLTTIPPLSPTIILSSDSANINNTIISNIPNICNNSQNEPQMSTFCNTPSPPLASLSPINLSPQGNFPDLTTQYSDSENENNNTNNDMNNNYNATLLEKQDQQTTSFTLSDSTVNSDLPWLNDIFNIYCIFLPSLLCHLFS